MAHSTDFTVLWQEGNKLVQTDPEGDLWRLRSRIEEMTEAQLYMEIWRRHITPCENLQILRNRLERHELRRVLGPRAARWDEAIDGQKLTDDMENTREDKPSLLQKYYPAEFDPVPIIHSVIVPSEDPFEQNTRKLDIPVLHSTFSQTPSDPESCGASLSSTIEESPVPRIKSRIPYYQRSTLLKYPRSLGSDSRCSSELSCGMEHSSDEIESSQSARSSIKVTSNCGDSSEERLMDTMLLTISTAPNNKELMSNMRKSSPMYGIRPREDSPKFPIEITPFEKFNPTVAKPKRKRKRTKRRSSNSSSPVEQWNRKEQGSGSRTSVTLPMLDGWEKRSQRGFLTWFRRENLLVQSTLGRQGSKAASRSSRGSSVARRDSEGPKRFVGGPGLLPTLDGWNKRGQMGSQQSSRRENPSAHRTSIPHFYKEATRRRKCWNCSGEGHTFRACPSSQVRLFCYRCGRKNKTRRSCDRCAENSPNYTNFEHCLSDLQSDVPSKESIFRRKYCFRKPWSPAYFQSGVESTSRTLL